MKNTIRHLGLDRLCAASMTFALAWGTMASATAAATPYQLPLLGVSPVAPNVIFTLDDSGSMLSPLMPDSLTSDKADGNCCNVQTLAPEEVVTQYDYNTNEKAYGLIPTRMPNRPAAEYLADATRRSSQSNTIYYDPEERYEPWTNSDGSLRTVPTASNTTTWTKVPTEGTSILTDFTPRVLPTNTKWCLTLDKCDSRSNYDGSTSETNARNDYDPTVYYILDNAVSPTVAGTKRVSIWNMKVYQSGSPQVTSVSNFTRGDKRTDCALLSSGQRSCSQAQELQNFATWYRYHRTRLMLAKASVSKAFSSPDVTGFRLGWGALNNLDTSNQTIAIDGVNTKTLRQGVRNYTTAHRDAFYNWLFNKDANSGTPLRRAVDDIGKYYSREDNKGPWSDEPGTSNSQTAGSYAACRRAFHILTTDGYWSSDSASAAATPGAQVDVESVDGPTITGPNAQTYQYKASSSANTRYKDGVANMLADVAMYYWNRDITPNIPNKLSPTAANEAFWQHMVNYTVGLGVSGRLKNPDDKDALEATPQTKTWQLSGTTASTANDDAKADDLWHAAYNSRGLNLNVTNSTEFASSLQAILTDIAAESNKTAGVGLTGAILGADAAKYVPEYTSRDWSGDLKKFALNPDTGISATTATWAAASQLPAYTNRSIFVGTGTGTGANGPAPAEAKEFALANLSPAMIAEMGTSPAVNDNLIQYLRGRNDADFIKATGYRQRSGVLGDIVNSTPLYVKSGIDYQYNVISGAPGNTYRDFLKTMATRRALIYVGANDGMMHVFADNTGEEVFAYIPRAVTANLNKLADKNYGHRFFVDGPATESHAYWGGSWNSVVLGTMGSGGKGVFAINATSPASLADKTTAAGQVLWELNGSNADLGYIYGEVETGPINYNGATVWVALINNGYDSNSNKAKLLIVDISNGRILKTIDTNRGSDTQPNGLGGVRAVRNASGLIVAAYAGDALGNVWRFDLGSGDASKWNAAYGANPLFIAKDPDNATQPITAAPAIVSHPRGGNLIVVATGKLIDEVDRPGVSPAASQIQTIYGLWDKQFASATTTSDQAASLISGKSALVQQVINTTPVATSADGRSYYTISTTLPNWSTQRGWYLNMTLATGQRVIYPAQSYQGRVLIGSVVPTTSTSCGAASAFNFYLDALTGNANGKILIDTNGDGVLDSRDAANVGIYTGANDGRDRIVVRERQRVGKEGGGAGGGGDCEEGALIVSATNNKPQCGGGGPIAGSRTWRILTNPPRIGDPIQ